MPSVNFVESLFQSVMVERTTLLSISPPKNIMSSSDKFGFGQSEVARRARQRQEEEELQFLKAEALFVQFVAEHNLPFRTGDHCL